MEKRRHITIYSAGCPICDEAIQTVNDLACASCEVEILDLNDSNTAARAASLSIGSIPSVVIDGKLVDCCVGSGISPEVLLAAGVGIRL